MTIDDPTGPFVLCYDGSEAAGRAIRIAPVLLGPGRAARVLYAYKPTERSLGIAQAVTGGRIDAPVSGEADAHDVVDAGVAIAARPGSRRRPAHRRRPAQSSSRPPDELDAPGIVMGQRGLTVLGSVSRDVVNAYTDRDPRGAIPALAPDAR